MGILVPIILFIIIGWVIKVLSDNSVKRMLIAQDKLDDNAKFLFLDRFDRYVPNSLKWGMVFVALGLAIFLGKVITSLPMARMGFRDEEVIIFSLMFIFGGIALIIYYGIAVKVIKKQENEKQ